MSALPTPYAIATTRGSSTSVCPTATEKPALHPPLAPKAAVEAVRGPGASAPEALTTTTFAAKAGSIGAPFPRAPFKPGALEQAAALQELHGFEEAEVVALPSSRAAPSSSGCPGSWPGPR